MQNKTYEYAIKVKTGIVKLSDIPVRFRNSVESLLNNNNDLVNYLRDAKWQEIKQERDYLEKSGVPFKGSVLDYDMLSVIRLTQAKDALQEAINLGKITEAEATVEWTMQDNSTMELSLSDLQMIPLVASNYSNELHQKSRKYREQIEGSSDISFINNIKWEKSL
ncbi:DUF4376 domain-containing protein [uncultured Phascolarctobacterium sp.]|uniref:DUF4376 domain-containing protein n=1 Tax=uncultured Phascolarctobacterium sp. TaxID=512296 RepID=UPI00261769B2|nr:DUF4376 domain-containing protein [uncultured Phascolarctobacterium sp.]